MTYKYMKNTNRESCTTNKKKQAETVLPTNRIDFRKWNSTAFAAKKELKFAQATNIHQKQWMSSGFYAKNIYARICTQVHQSQYKRIFYTNSERVRPSAIAHKQTSTRTTDTDTEPTASSSSDSSRSSAVVYCCSALAVCYHSFVLLFCTHFHAVCRSAQMYSNTCVCARSFFIHVKHSKHSDRI